MGKREREKEKRVGEWKGEEGDRKVGDGKVAKEWGMEGGDMKAGDGEAVEGWGNGREVT